jgi:hypothetical protein
MVIRIVKQHASHSIYASAEICEQPALALKPALQATVRISTGMQNKVRTSSWCISRGAINRCISGCSTRDSSSALSSSSVYSALPVVLLAVIGNLSAAACCNNRVPVTCFLGTKVSTQTVCKRRGASRQPDASTSTHSG